MECVFRATLDLNRRPVSRFCTYPQQIGFPHPPDLLNVTTVVAPLLVRPWKLSSVRHAGTRRANMSLGAGAVSGRLRRYREQRRYSALRYARMGTGPGLPK